MPRDIVDAALANLTGSPNGNGHVTDTARWAVTFTDDKTPKLKLPQVPEHDDQLGQIAWLNSVLQLDPAHPITHGVRQGVRGADAHAELRRASAPPIRFEPISLVYIARKLRPVIGTQLLPTDGKPYGFKDEHAADIAHVLQLLCQASQARTEEDETTGVVGTYLSAAVAIEGLTTYGPGVQRYEAAVALQAELDETGRPTRARRYLIDRDTGELVIRVGDLQTAAREHIGSGLPRGWLDARMEGIGWARVKLDGHGAGGRDGREGHGHAKPDVYRGHLPGTDDPGTDDPSVTT